VSRERHWVIWNGVWRCQAGLLADAARRRVRLDEKGESTTWIYDAADNRLLWEDKAGKTTYLYDQAGNQVSKIIPAANRETRLWDYEQRARVVIQSTGDLTTYTVDGDLKRGRRDPADLKGHVGLRRRERTRRGRRPWSDEGEILQSALEPEATQWKSCSRRGQEHQH